jgi:hypothetical protein
MAREQVRWTADRRLYLDANDRVVEANDPTRVKLLVSAGNTIPLADAQRYGLVSNDGAKAVSKAPANKALAGPVENKAGQIADVIVQTNDTAGTAQPSAAASDADPTPDRTTAKAPKK